MDDNQLQNTANAAATSAATTAVMSTDIAYIKRDIAEIKASFQELSTKYAIKADIDTMVKDGQLVHEDHETRIRSLEKTQTQTLTWGTVGILAIGVIEFVVIHFVK